uniref:Uncharacterized protein n=1 Tax=Coccolithus braarudii TaxID=221442 RepID=A0A7S0LG50_9EUKA
MPPIRCAPAHSDCIVSCCILRQDCITQLCKVFDLDPDTLRDALEYEALDPLEHSFALMPKPTAQTDHNDRSVELNKLCLARDSNCLRFRVVAKNGCEVTLALAYDLDHVFLCQHE